MAAKSRIGRGRRLTWVSAVLVLILGSAAGCRALDGAPATFPGVPGGAPYPTVAWFDPVSPSIVVAGHDCGEKVRVQESGRIVRIGTFSLPTRGGAAVACAQTPAQVVHLRAPLGRRALVGLDRSPLRALAWRSRLHLPWTAGMQLNVPSSNSTTWVLGSVTRAAGASGYVTLTSRPAPRPGIGSSGRTTNVLVRGYRALAACPVDICWNERGVSYQLTYSVAYPGPQIAPAVARLRAIAVAASLGYT